MSDRAQRYLHAGAPRGFTLIEVLLAMAIFTVLVGALYSVFYGALRLRERTFEVTEAALPKDYIATIVKRDLTSIVPPVGILAGPMIGENEEDGEQRLDSLEFHTGSGIVNDYDPWGNIQKIEYYLVDSEEWGEPEGYSFVRAVTRNLLASTTEDPEEERLLNRVQSLEFAYYDGEYWQDVWDSTTQDDETPVAVMMRIDFLPSEEGERQSRPIELVCEVVTEAVETEQQQGGMV